MCGFSVWLQFYVHIKLVGYLSESILVEEPKLTNSKRKSHRNIWEMVVILKLKTMEDKDTRFDCSIGLAMFSTWHLQQ